jgi:hypothetical protein
MEQGDTDAKDLLVSAWFEGKTDYFLSAADQLLANYYKFDLEESKKLAMNDGDLLAMIGIHTYWQNEGKKEAPSKEDQISIRTAFDAAFSKRYENLTQKVILGDSNALDEMKRIWWACQKLNKDPFENFCSSISIERVGYSKSQAERNALKMAYNVARVPNYFEIQEKALKKDQAARETLFEKWADGSLEPLDTVPEPDDGCLDDTLKDGASRSFSSYTEPGRFERHQYSRLEKAINRAKEKYQKLKAKYNNTI